MRDLQNASKFAARRKRYRIWRSIVTGIAAVVVFCTTYALILPAITMETQGLTCGLEAHTHGPECDQLTCGKQEIFSHTHTDECYEEDELICTLEERTLHHHSDSCYSHAEPVCGKTEAQPHTHAEECYEMQSVLTCGLEEGEEHTHTEACYQDQQVLTCGLDETEGHTHTEACYPADFEPQLICEEEDIPEHRHTEECYIRVCELEEHTHTDACVDSHEAFLENQKQLAPGDDETEIDWTDPEAAEAAGYLLLCEEDDEAHVHTGDCYALAEELLAETGVALFSTARSEEGSENDDPNAGIMLLTVEEALPVVGSGPSATGTTYNAEEDTFSASVTINFSFPGKETEKAVSANTVYTYTYPEGMIIPDGLLNKKETLLDKAGNPAGTYEFIKTGDIYSVRVIFSEDYVSSNKVGIGLDKPVEGFVSYSYKFSGSQLTEGGLKFGEAGYTLPISPPITYPDGSVTESYDIDVNKVGNWVQDEEKLVYTVYVRTTKGTPDPISLTDVLTDPENHALTGLTLGNPTITVEKGTTTYYTGWQSDGSDWTAVSPRSSNYENGNLSMSLDALTANKTVDTNGTSCVIADVYRITYAYPITEQTAESIPTKNKVTVTASDHAKGQTIAKDATSNPTITKDFSYTLTKNGLVSSEKPGYIKWVVTLNSNKQDLLNAVFTDEMLKQVTNTSADIQISPSSDGIAVDAANGRITFTEVSNGANKTPYTVTYYTPVEQTWDGSTVSNSAALDPDPSKTGDEVTTTFDVTVSGVQLGKTGGHNVASDKLDWTITVNAGKLDIAGAELEDSMFSDLEEGAFAISPSDYYEFIKNSDNKITGIRFKAVTEDGKNTQSYTITYSTAIPTGEGGAPASSVTNTATLSPGEGKTGTPITVSPSVSLEEPNLEKAGEYWDNRIKWTVTVNENKKNIAGAVLTDSMLGQLTPGEITIQDGNWQSVPESEYEIHTNGEGKVTEIAFLSIAGGVNSNQYKLTYFTTSLPEWKDKTVQNAAKLTLNGKEIPKTAEVNVPGWGWTTKSAGKATVDGNTLTIPWTVTLTVPKGGLARGTVITDDVTKNQYGNTNTNQWITPAQITDWNDPTKGMTWTWMDDQGNSKGTVVFRNTETNTAIALTGSETVNETTVYKGFQITLPEAAVPPEGATKLTFTYTTTSDVTGVSDVQTKYYNFVDVDGKQASAECVYYKPSIQKTDGNWQTGTSNVSSPGSLTWMVKASAGMNNHSLSLIDTLPEGVILDSLQLTGWGSLNVALTVANGEISGTDGTNQYSISGTYVNQVITLNITPLTDGNTIQNGAEFTLAVNCTIPNAESVTGTKQLKNDVTMKLDNEEIGSSSQTQNWTYREDTTGVVSKTGQWDNNPRLLKYAVVINPDGRDLDKNSETHEVELEDVLKYKNQVWVNGVLIDVNISLKPGSITLKNNQTNQAIADWSWRYSTKAQDEWNPNDIVNTLTVTVPDEVPLRLEYSYSVTSSAEEGVTFNLNVSNTATLKQTAYGDDYRFGEGAKWQSQTSSGGITSASSLLTLTKVDADNNGNFLQGAEFTISSYREKTVEGVTTGYWREDWTETTDSNGAITIVQGEASKGQRVYDTDVFYKVVETKAPTNYLLPNPATEFYFYFSGPNSATMAKPADISLVNAIDLNKIGNSIIVKNTKIPTTSIQVDKQWKDTNGNPLLNPGDSVSVSLYRKTTQSSSSGGSSGGTQVNISANIKGTDVSSKLSMTSVESGSKIRIKVELSFAIEESWNWVPPIAITGVDGAATTGWILADSSANGHGTFTYEGLVTGDVTISYGNNDGDITAISVTVLEPPTTSSSGGAGGSTPSPSEGTLVKTVTLDNANSWTHTFTDLPLIGSDENGNTVNFYYYAIEAANPNYQTSYENNGGIQNGTITVTNKLLSNPAYTLPATGGSGTKLFTVAGLAVSIGACLGLMKKRRRGGTDGQ